MEGTRRGTSPTLKYERVTLWSLYDVVRFHLFVQNSLSPLDLAVIEEPVSPNNLNHRRPSRRSVVFRDLFTQLPKYPNDLVNTEEKCRKILSDSRDLLYRLHLDMPKNRECSLKNSPEPENVLESDYRRHISKITVVKDFHFQILSSLVEEAVKRSDEKLKMIKWLVTFDAVTEDASLDGEQISYFGNLMYSDVEAASSFVQAFCKKCDLFFWMGSHGQPQLLEYFLYNLHQNGRNMKYTDYSWDEIDVCVHSLRFLNIGPLMKYQDAPQIPPRRNPYFYFRTGITKETEKKMNPRRFYLMSQLIYIHFECTVLNVSNTTWFYASKFLRLLWNSIPDAFFTFEEIDSALKGGLNAEKSKKLFDFYSDAVGALLSIDEPRPLKHLCRTAIRRRIFENNWWIPDGIRLTGLPNQLQSFLSLES